MKLFNVVLEAIESRYTEQWQRWFDMVFAQHGMKYPEHVESIHGGVGKTVTVSRGQFLDVVDTHIWKFRQMDELFKRINKREVKDGDWIFFHDLWFPGLEALFYIRQGLGLNFKIAGVMHAGTYDNHDFLYQKGMASWGRLLENCWFDQIDKIFLSVPFHKDLIFKRRDVNPHKLVCTYLPIFPPPKYATEEERKDVVVFPHRIAPEKQPEKFDELRSYFKEDVQFVRTQDVPRDKKEYYRLLQTSKVAVSYNLQETWGISMQEAVLCGCIPIVPNRLSYPDIFPKCFLYDSEEMIHEHVLDNLTNYNLIIESDPFQELRNKIIDNGALAISRMLREMGFI